MPRRTPPVYQRGKYWLAHDERADGTLRSPNLYIWWYDSGTRRERSTSTATSDVAAAILELDKVYLADKGEAPAFCHACGQPLAQAQAYLLTDAIADYKIEWGNTRASADTISGRLAHAVAFLDAEHALGAEGRFGHSTSCATACGTVFVNAFRAWSRLQPVEWRNGKGEVTVSRPRSPAATEASIAQLIAVLNHAANAEPARSDKRPIYKPLPARQVQRQRRTRIGVEELAKMFAYAAEPDRQRGSLHAFLVASVCTIARPGAVVDINVAPDREQWWPGAPTLDLNPQGRTQNKKHRAVLPVLPLLDRWLREEYETYMALPIPDRAGRGWLVNYHGRAIQDVDRAWDTMLTNLDMPAGREWRPYLLRHSLATLVRNNGAKKWDLEGFMGHRDGSQTEVYAIGEFPTVVRALNRIIAKIEKLAPGSTHRNPTGTRVAEKSAGDRKM
ncbi:phage integrase family protein [Sphingomonas faeni]|uniref:Phage integrase family protein n=1 Tax=Sphingomonas faeni TaxID=185950 RepID=A0A2T5TZH0_9SPHN|nr:tyrosine-type recombinase/integrase [Sphingomonas faeni]PTW44663.1 phage integrase family protein [Sphingomonas faeni]